MKVMRHQNARDTSSLVMVWVYINPGASKDAQQQCYEEELSMPSKTVSHLAAGNAAGESVANEGAGAVLQREHLQQLVNARALLRQRLGQRALELRRVQQHFAHRQLRQQRVKLLHVPCGQT